MKPDSTEPVVVEPSRGYSGSQLARKGLPLASGGEGQGGPHGQVCVMRSVLPPLTMDSPRHSSEL